MPLEFVILEAEEEPPYEIARIGEFLHILGPPPSQPSLVLCEPALMRSLWRIKSEYDRFIHVDEGRKRVLLIAASILATRKLAQFDAGKRVPATISAITDAVRWAEEIMKAIDDRFPVAMKKPDCD